MNCQKRAGSHQQVLPGFKLFGALSKDLEVKGQPQSWRSTPRVGGQPPELEVNLKSWRSTPELGFNLKSLGSGRRMLYALIA